ncbi:MAG: DUF4129 domain-containing protein [Clostridia bacterium]|nr:DUF4129 domain-containing protein [Clostridia bacterium]
MTFSRIIIVLASLLAELCCIYPLYFLLATGSGALPIITPWWFLALAGVVAVSNLLLSTGRLRLLTVVLFNLFLVVISSSWLIQQNFFPTSSFFTLSWVTKFFADNNGFFNLYRNWLLLVFIFWVYYRAVLLARKVPAFNEAISRLDISLGTLFVLLLASTLTGIHLPGALIWLLVLLLSNAVAIASTQSGKRLPRQSTWVGPGFLAVLLLPGVLAVTIFFPQLATLGEMTYTASLPLVQWLGSILLKIFLWLLRHSHMVPAKELAPSTTPAQPEPEINPEATLPAWLAALLEKLGSLAVLLFLLAVAAVVFYLLYCLICWLWRYQEPAADTPDSKRLFAWWHSFLLRLSSWLSALKLAILPWLNINQGPVASYQALLRWGRRQRHPRLKHETPYEYLQRLTQHFPENQADLSLITEQYVFYRYSGKPLADPFAENKLQAALRRLGLALPRRTAISLKNLILTLISRLKKQNN